VPVLSPSDVRNGPLPLGAGSCILWQSQIPDGAPFNRGRKERGMA